MEVRTYYASTVEIAFALARRDFGAEAMLMQSTRTAPDSNHRGHYEVVFAGEPLASAIRTKLENPTPARSQPAAPAYLWPTLGSSTPGIVRPAKVSMEEITFGPVDLVVKSPSRKTLRLAPPPDVALSRMDAPFLRVECNPGLGRPGLLSSTVVLAGPTGSGKTATAMKLAVRYGLLAARPCRLIAYDPERVGTTERLRYFSTLLKIPFESAETPSQLSAAMNRVTPGLTIVDTPGCSPADDSVLAGLAFLLRSHRGVETQLVLRADRKASLNIASASRFSALAPKRLVLTALDETSDYSELEALVAAVGLPLSFLGTGQRIPDDLEAATTHRLEGLIHHGWSRTAAAAA